MAGNDNRKLLSLEYRPPVLCKTTLEQVLLDLLGVKCNVRSMTEFDSFRDRNYHVQIDLDQLDHYLESQGLQIKDVQLAQNQSDPSFVLKILNSAEVEKYDQNLAKLTIMRDLHNQGIPCPKPLLLSNNNLMKIIRIVKSNDDDLHNHIQYIAYLLTYIEGQIVATIHPSTQLLYKLGSLAGKFDAQLQTYSDSRLLDQNYIWSLQYFPLLKDYLPYCSEDKKDLLSKTYHRLLPYFEHQINHLRWTIIHTDITDTNVIIQLNRQTNTYDICGIIDFGVIDYGATIFELAITMAHLLLSINHDQFRALGHIISGYHSVFPITKEEYKGLYTLLVARLVQTLTLCKFVSTVDPDNPFVMSSYENKWDKLKLILSISESDVYAIWDPIVGLSSDNNFYNFLSSPNGNENQS